MSDTEAPLPAGLQPLPAPQQYRSARLGVGGAIGIALAVIVNLSLIALLALLALNMQRVSDQISVWRFTPDATITAHVDRTAMTDEGKFYFYASHPAVVAEKEFDPICASDEDGEGILGCYLLSNRQIYIYDITDDRLDGAEEVTAAHEMLHAAWERTPASTQQRIGALLEAEVAKRSDDAELTERLAYYAKAEPGERDNELHSIVGTEFADISDELETYYATYFSDRSKVVALNEKSQVVIREQLAEGDALVVKMDALADSIDADYAAYNAGYDQLNADIDDYNARFDTGYFTSQDQVDAEYYALVNRQAELDALYDSIDARTTEYNDLNAQLDALSAVIDDLNAHLNIDPPRTTDG